MLELFIGIGSAVLGFVAGVIVANVTNSKVEASLVEAYNRAIATYIAQRDEARARVAKRRRLASWS